MKICRLSIVAVCVGCALIAARPASAQQDAEGAGAAAARRPYRGLFGTGPVAESGQHLVATGIVNGGYDDNVLAGDQGAAVRARDARFQQPGYFSGVNSGLTYTVAGDTVNLLATGSASGRYFVDQHEFGFTGMRAAETLGVSLGRTTITAASSFLRSPHFGIGLFPSIPPVSSDAAPVDTLALSGEDFDVARQLTRVVVAQAGISRRLSARATVLASYTYQDAKFPNTTGVDSGAQGAFGRYQYQVTRHATLKLGYGYQQFHSSSAVRTHLHNIDAGVDYSRSLSFTRRTTLNFSSGSAVVRHDAGTQFHINGAADLEHEMGRTWTAHVSYRRGLRLISGFDTPTFFDSVAGTVGGSFSRRTELQVTTGYVSGGSDLTATGGSGYHSLAGMATLRYALSRYFAAYTEYLYYRYELGAQLRLPPGLARNMDRQGARVGLSASIPLF